MSKKITFGICALSSYADDRLDQGIQRLRDLGHDVVVHPQAHGRLGQTQLAGTVSEKIDALYDLLGDKNVDAVLFACGGNGVVHLLDQISFDVFNKHPKPIIGFSDITALSNAVYHKTGLVTYHGPMAYSFRPDTFNADHYQQMIDIVSGTARAIPLPGAHTQTPGTATGKLIGGNLEGFRAMVGTPYMPDTTGAIIFLEDIGLELNHLDRTLCSLKLTGLFDRAAGLMFGQFTNMLDTGRPFGFTADEIIAAHTAHLNIPVATNAPFGHIGMFPTFPVGATATLDTRGPTPTLTLA